MHKFSTAATESSGVLHRLCDPQAGAPGLLVPRFIDRVVFVAIATVSNHEYQGSELTEAPVGSLELSLELFKDFPIAGIRIGPRPDFDAVLIDVVTQHECEVTASLAANLVHGMTYPVLTSLAGPAIAKDQDDQLIPVSPGQLTVSASVIIRYRIGQ